MKPREMAHRTGTVYVKSYYQIRRKRLTMINWYFRARPHEGPIRHAWFYAGVFGRGY